MLTRSEAVSRNRQIEQHFLAGVGAGAVGGANGQVHRTAFPKASKTDGRSVGRKRSYGEAAFESRVGVP
jgi:hypothetical protein